MFVGIAHACGTLRGQEGTSIRFKSTGTRVPGGCWEPNLDPLEVQNS